MKMKNMKMNGHAMSTSKQEAIQQYKRIKNHKTRLTRDHIAPKPQNDFKKLSQEEFEKNYLDN